jgi:cytochrome c2
MTFFRRFIALGIVGVLALMIAGCSSGDPKVALAALPKGDPAHGQQIFLNGTNGAVPCATCHNTDTITKVGPGLAGISQRAVTRVQGESGEEYIFESIMRPARFIVPGFSNLMPPDFEKKFTPQDIADLIAYLDTL